MSSLEAYKDWEDIFDENVYKIWQDEPNSLLKKISMMFFSIKREIHKIAESLECDVTILRKNISESRRTSHSSPLRKFTFTSRGSFNKENLLSEILTQSTTPSTATPEIITLLDSPEIFQSQNIESLKDSVVISEEDSLRIGTQSGSPEIKKRKRNIFSSRNKKLRNTSSTPSICFLQKPISDKQFDNITNSDQAESTNDPSSIDFLKDLEDSNYQRVRKTDKKDNLQTKNSNPKLENILLTPLRDHDNIDMSIVESTPDLKIILPKRKDRKRSAKTRSRPISGQNSISVVDSRQNDADQMFSDSKNICKEKKDIPSAMGITQLVDFINDDSASNHSTNINEERHTLNFKADPRDQDKFGSQADVSLNSAVLEVEPGELNEFLAKAQGILDNPVVNDEVVRGKARQNMPGWSCKDCEMFYLNQGLKLPQILALNKKCSRHRGFQRPREDTPQGFWDMTVGNSESEVN